MKTTICIEERTEVLDVEVRDGVATVSIRHSNGIRRVMRDLQDAVEELYPLTHFSVATQFSALGNLAAGIADSLKTHALRAL